MACAVRSCRNEVARRQDLSFFNLPTLHDVREEWLEVLAIERPEYWKKIKVCELHFKPKDFCEGRKRLKSHAIPVLKLGSTSKSEALDSDEEFMDFRSDSDQEIVEIPDSKQANEKNKEETPTAPETNEEPTEGRRPSRRAAREAAKKIYNTVHSFMPKAGDGVYEPPSNSPAPTRSPAVSRSPSTAPRLYTYTPSRLKKRASQKLPSADIDLVMECHEEILSPVQAEALLKSQLEYNMVMKTLRTLKASNAKIIFSKEPYTGVPPAPATTVPVSSAGVVPLKLANNPAIQITKTTIPA